MRVSLFSDEGFAIAMRLARVRAALATRPDLARAARDYGATRRAKMGVSGES
ncbi:hypothetical protein [Sphingobium sp. YG1]|uniref:hypothetical protein n=1 Tax=Sphingobium sp. YG1 TaxID=2082188 RepID=UPI000DBB9789|nr:hypothetical protein [Sphingobium sp. YG1]BBC99111.1 hypothetical protein YGS_C1P0367 [Sphingobium sp. YG1]